jgi:hypothetical protein
VWRQVVTFLDAQLATNRAEYEFRFDERQAHLEAINAILTGRDRETSAVSTPDQAEE